MNKSEFCLRDLEDTVKQAIIHFMSCRRRRKKKIVERMFEEIIAKNF